MTLRVLLRDLLDGYAYVRDPHGYEQRIREAERFRFTDRPAMYQLRRGGFIVHPALHAALVKELKQSPEPYNRLQGIDITVSQLAVAPPPSGGWPDVKPLERPRLRT